MFTSVNNGLWKRLLFNLAMLLSLFYFPWWITALIGLLFIVSVRPLEIVLWGIVLDAFGAQPVPAYGNFQYFFTMVFLLALIVTKIVRRRIMFRNPPL
jgi:hypothetical protein